MVLKGSRRRILTRRAAVLNDQENDFIKSGPNLFKARVIALLYRDRELYIPRGTGLSTTRCTFIYDVPPFLNNIAVRGD